jgi:carbamoyl-phosphate synthase small subunit
MIKEAILALEDGTVFRGCAFGAEGECSGEVVFNTSMAGYQEILTDPSYKGQIVTMTYPLIGNYGTNPQDIESRQPFVEGFVVREKSRVASNWRSEQALEDYLKCHNIVGIEGIDTRALTRHIRLQGAMKGIISTQDLDKKSLVKKAQASPGLVGLDLVKEVTCNKFYDWTEPLYADANCSPLTANRFFVVVLDCGVKLNILRNLVSHGCHVKVVPAKTTAKEILSLKPDGIVLSNGPGDPAAVSYVIDTVRELIYQAPSTKHQTPIFGICLGHQMFGLAFGGQTYKLKFGHHGGNHPVMDLATRRVEITAQNHGFCVDIDSIPDKDVELTHINLYDKTVEGLRHKKLPIFSVQYHPEASPGPHDARYLFGRFVEMMRRKNQRSLSNY